ncbi:hypothetical protein [Methanogenium organophilum]|uniref:Uncharacterized protein n=1 Tax=Methanogenium organophilum TaxID=2199 RepID=A0A9X9S5G8_METOG|nr:hypothetical protein [Methanogenium organophilum]WAI02284.1 hypothetical protein OU421_05275 [Methanogenium organophilum]
MSLRPGPAGLAGLFLLTWFTAFIWYGLGPLLWMVDTWVWSNPQVWFLPFDLAVGIIFPWIFARTIKRKYLGQPWLPFREDR